VANPAPDDLRAELDRTVDNFIDQYRWAYNLGFDRPSHGPDRRTRGGGTPDPTHATVMGQGKVRGKVKLAARRARQAMAKLEDGLEFLHQAFEVADVDHDPLPMLPSEEFQLITKREHSKAKDARDRREARGEGWGVG
jgi:hypothetical protein